MSARACIIHIFVIDSIIPRGRLVAQATLFYCVDALR